MSIHITSYNTDKKLVNEGILLQVALRKVKRKDWDFILRLRNNKDYRQFFYSQKIISKKEHYNYLAKQKSNPNFMNWIITYGSKDAGYLRVLNNDVSIMIEKKYNNKGIGTTALQLLEKQARKQGIKKLVGRVMIHNKSSKKIFLKNNYKLRMYWLEKDLLI